MRAFDTAEPIPRWAIPGGLVVCAALVWAGYRWPDLSTANPAVEVLKLAIAAAIGVFVTAVHRPGRRTGKSRQPVAHAQILFCVAGALMMIIIDDSLARAFGAVGIASLVRFRTALKDPKEATILFLLIGLGMAVGRGILGVAGLGTLFLAALLWLLDRTAADKLHDATLEVRFGGPDFPLAHVRDVLDRNHVAAEAHEIEQSGEPIVRYHVVLDGKTSPDQIGRELMDGGDQSIRAVKWELTMHKDD